MRLFSAFDIWFRPKGFETERLYERLGALLIKRYVPTGGDLVMQRLRRHHPGRRWVTSSIQSLRRYEQRTRLNESIHLVGFIGFTVLAANKFASGSLTDLPQISTDKRSGVQRTLTVYRLARNGFEDHNRTSGSNRSIRDCEGLS